MNWFFKAFLWASLHCPPSDCHKEEIQLSLMALPAGREAASSIQRDPCTLVRWQAQGSLRRRTEDRRAAHCCFRLSFFSISCSGAHGEGAGMSTPVCVHFWPSQAAALVLIPRNRERRKGQERVLGSCLVCSLLQAFLWAMKTIKSFPSVLVWLL